jgi:hypothetical protein
MNKINHKNIVYLVGLHIYCKMIHGTYNIKWLFIKHRNNCNSCMFQCPIGLSGGDISKYQPYHKDWCFLIRNAEQSGKNLQTCGMKLQPPHSGLKNKPAEELTRKWGARISSEAMTIFCTVYCVPSQKTDYRRHSLSFCQSLMAAIDYSIFPLVIL